MFEDGSGDHDIRCPSKQALWKNGKLFWWNPNKQCVIKQGMAEQMVLRLLVHPHAMKRFHEGWAESIQVLQFLHNLESFRAFAAVTWHGRWRFASEHCHQILIICSNGIALDNWYIVRFWICYAHVFYGLFCPKILFEERDKETCICVNGTFWEAA